MLPASPHERGVLLAGLLREDLFIALYRAVAEAKTAEHGARLSAMQAAEQNIEERITTLRNQYHQLRQAQITEELLDVVSGFEALEQR
jgi:F-type H+-transporting ATPase subunit gamma